MDYAASTNTRSCNWPSDAGSIFLTLPLLMKLKEAPTSVDALVGRASNDFLQGHKVSPVPTPADSEEMLGSAPDSSTPVYQ